MGATYRKFLSCRHVPGIGPGGISFGGEAKADRVFVGKGGLAFGGILRLATVVSNGGFGFSGSGISAETVVAKGGVGFSGAGVNPPAPPLVGHGGVAFGGAGVNPPPTVGKGGAAFGGNVSLPIVYVGKGGAAFGGNADVQENRMDFGGPAFGGNAKSVFVPACHLFTGGQGPKQLFFVLPSMTNSLWSGCELSSGENILDWQSDCSWLGPVLLMHDQFGALEPTQWKFFLLVDLGGGNGIWQLRTVPTNLAAYQFTGPWDGTGRLVLSLVVDNSLCAGFPPVVEIAGV